MIGAITFERSPAEGAFNAETVELCEQIGALVGPILELRRREERSLASKACDSCRRQLSRLFGTGHLTLKAGATALVGLTIFFCLVNGQYQIPADASLEGAIERVVVAPQEGFIVTANARPGDVVKKGDVLAGLDDRDLKLERLKWSSQRQQLTKEHREALAKHDRAAISILGARLAQADAQIELLEKQLDRTQVEAPFDGVIVEGDLKRALGSPVERGQILYKVAPLDDYRIVLEVDEREISEVKVGHHGQVTLAAAPGEPLAFVVQRVTPVSNAEEGNNFFQVEAQLQERLNFLRPGMQGVGKIEIGQRKLIWIWSHKMLDWIRLWLWSWWP
jgi:RND family efflux transporter MFP subunit